MTKDHVVDMTRRCPLHTAGEARAAADAIMNARVVAESFLRSTVGCDELLHAMEMEYYRRADELAAKEKSDAP